MDIGEIGKEEKAVFPLEASLGIFNSCSFHAQHEAVFPAAERLGNQWHTFNQTRLW